MAKNILTPEQLTLELIDAKKGGVLAVANKFNVSRPVIARLCTLYGISERLYFDMRIPAKEQLVNDLQSGLTMQKMCAKYNTFPRELKKWFKLRDVSIVYNRRKRAPLILDKQELEHKVTVLKKSFKEISGECGVSDVTIGNWCRDFNITPSNKAWNQTSKIEQKLQAYISTVLKMETARKLLVLPDNKRGDIDLYNEAARLGVEVNGLYWHSEERVGRNYHKDKTEAAKRQNITLMHFWDHEVQTKFEIVSSLICSKANIFKRYFYARKLKLVVDDTRVREFLKRNHLNGAPANIKKSFSLVDNDNNIVCTLTFSSHHRLQKNNDSIVLSRLCFAIDTTVVGGTDKMFKHALDFYKTSNYSHIISWSDNRWTYGDVYTRLNFVKEKVYPPDYFYWKGNEIASKQSKMKSLTGCPADKTESEWMKICGYRRVFDCGKTKWRFTLHDALDT